MVEQEKIDDVGLGEKQSNLKFPFLNYLLKMGKMIFMLLCHKIIYGTVIFLGVTENATQC